MEAASSTRLEERSGGETQPGAAPVVGGPRERVHAGTQPKFDHGGAFQQEVRRRVEDYFRRTERRQRDCPQMYGKTAIVFAWFIASYVMLVCLATTWWQALPLAIALGLALAAIGFNVQHDGRHQAYSDRPWVNQLAAFSMDLMGGSSYVWYWKHNVIHHTYVNIAGHDNDIDLGLLARLTPHHRRLPFHRFQHVYLWPLYAFALMKWQLFDDFRDVLTGRIGTFAFRRPRGWDLAAFLAGKAAFLTLAFAVPLWLHPLEDVVLGYVLVSGVTGLTLSVVFQLAHAVGQAAFPWPQGESRRMSGCWAMHQVATTVNFAQGNRVITWLLGGLNYQIEHHLFPRICHVNYPALAPLVEGACHEFGVPYSRHGSIWAGVAAHYRWLKAMGTA